jgi:hypothetical protein
LADTIPIKGYATFDPLKHCWIGSGFKIEWFRDLDIYKNDKIMDPLKRIAEETEEDYQKLEKILHDAEVKTYRSFLDIGKYKSLKNIYRPPVQPRDHFAVIGEKFYSIGAQSEGYSDVLKQIARKDMVIENGTPGSISTANISRVGKDIFWDIQAQTPKDTVEKYKRKWEEEGFRVHLSHRGYHSDGVFCVVRPGCIVTLHGIQNYKENFPGWDVLYLPENCWNNISPFLDLKDKVGGKWWLKGEEHNDQLIHFVNTWLDNWVGYVEETVFDVNMLSLDQNTVIVHNHNKEVFEHFKKHKVEPIIFKFRHQYFWDGGVHCITQDLYREGTQEDYFG